MHAPLDVCTKQKLSQSTDKQSRSIMNDTITISTTTTDGVSTNEETSVDEKNTYVTEQDEGLLVVQHDDGHVEVQEQVEEQYNPTNRGSQYSSLLGLLGVTVVVVVCLAVGLGVGLTRDSDDSNDDSRNSASDTVVNWTACFCNNLQEF